MQQVLIEFTSDASGLAPAEKALSNLTEGEKKLADQALKTSKDMNDGNSRVASSIDKLAAASKTLDKSVVGGAYRAYLKQIQTELGLTQKELIKYVQNARQSAQAAILDPSANEDVKELQVAVGIMNEVLEEFGVKMDQTSQKSTSLRTRIKEAKEELVAMAEAGLQGTPAFQELQNKAGELDDQMRDLNATIKGTGSDTKNIDGLISLAGGIAGGFAIAQGAAALFGDESEEMQQALLKVNAAMAILQGLQQIQNVLQKESAAMLLLANVRTKALALGQQFLTATTLESAAATTVLRTALITSGIGAIVVLVLSLANAFSEHNDKVEDATKLIDELDAAYGSLSRTITNYYTQTAELATAQGRNDVDVLKLRLAGVQQLIKANDELELRKRREFRANSANKELYEALNKTIEEGNKLRNDESVLEANISSAIKKNNEEKAKAEKEAADKRKAARDKIAKDAEDAMKKATAEELAELDKQVKAQLVAFDKQEEQLRIHFENEQEISNRDKQQKIKDAKDWDDLWKEFQESLVKSSEDAAKRIRDKEMVEMKKRMEQLQAVLSVFQQGLASTLGNTGLSTALSELANFAVKAKEIFDQVKAGVLTTAEGIKEIAEVAVAAAQNTINQIFADASSRRQQIATDEIAALEEQKQRELNVKNLTEQQKADIENRFRQQERRIKIEAFNADKEAKKSQALINAALGATLAIAEYPWPYSLVVAGIVAGFAGIEIAEINRQQPPRFKDGRINIDGPGTTTSDSIHAMISKGESVINAKSTSKYQDALEAINNDQFESFLANKFGDFSIPYMPEFVSTSTGFEIDYDKLSTAIADKMKGVIPSPAQVHNTIDENGLHSFIIEGSNRTEIRNKKYSMT